MLKHFLNAAIVVLVVAAAYTASRSTSAAMFSSSSEVGQGSRSQKDTYAFSAAQGQDRPIPYLPPKGLKGPGEVTEVTRENQHIVRSQLRGHQRPVLELIFSSQDPRSKNMEAWLDQAAKANPLVTFIKLDTSKLPVATPTPTIQLSIPRPPRSFSRTGYLSDGQLTQFLEDGLKSWTPIQHQQQPNLQHLPLPHFHKQPGGVPGRSPFAPQL